MDGQEYNRISEIIIGCAYTVANTLGGGFLEKVYENSMVIELEKNGIKVEQQKSITVLYDGKNVGDYFADLFVEDSIIVELKTVKNFQAIHEAQLINYLKATGQKLGILINFNKSKVEVRRLVNEL